eukprot:CAMPEP_0197195468 /NCGR_PEP_ID=MMETSP1423-20130617/31185_1 /TAXON_ID=476441 /ORGANISM="Pseudo-nitzschia heimii, Strain UNC1101" /LENGTH=42 /DNA_ID= /DNA_START= /DNA_END= /DNA_ORIENTATION=
MTPPRFRSTRSSSSLGPTAMALLLWWVLGMSSGSVTVVRSFG